MKVDRRYTIPKVSSPYRLMTNSTFGMDILRRHMTWYSCKMVMRCSYTINATFGGASFRTRRDKSKDSKSCSLTGRADGQIVHLGHPKQPIIQQVK